MLVLLSRRGRIERACLLHPCSHLRPSKAFVENMDAKRHAQPNDRLCASLAGHVRSTKVWTVSDERASPRGYAFFVPLGGGERPFGFTPTFTGRKYYSKNRRGVRGGFRSHAPNGTLPCEGILNVKLVLGEFVSCMSPCLMMSIPINISHTIRSPVETRNPATRTPQGKMASKR